MGEIYFHRNLAPFHFPTNCREVIKNTAAYDKQYLEGRYGADPYLSNMLGGEF